MAGLYGNVTVSKAVNHFLVVATGECMDAKKDVLFDLSTAATAVEVKAGCVFARDGVEPKGSIVAGDELFVSKTDSTGSIATSCGRIAGVPGGTGSVFITTEYDTTKTYTPGTNLKIKNRMLTPAVSSDIAVGVVSALPMAGRAQDTALAVDADRSVGSKTPLVSTFVDPSTELPVLAFTLNQTATTIA